MATFTKLPGFIEHLAEGVHNLGTGALTLALSNTAPGSEGTPPTGATTTCILANVTQISYTNCSSRVLTTSSSAQSAGTYSLVVNDLTLTASGGTVGPFRYVYVYNDTPTSPADPLIGYYDYGSSITLTGTNAGLAYGRKLVAGSGSFALSGTAAGLVAARKLTAGNGAFVLTGTAAGLKTARKLVAGNGAFALAGQDVTLTYTPVSGADYTLAADSAAFTLTGTAAALSRTYALVVASASFALAGDDVGFVHVRLWADTAAPTGTWADVSVVAAGWTGVGQATGTWANDNDAAFDGGIFDAEAFDTDGTRWSNDAQPIAAWA